MSYQDDLYEQITAILDDDVHRCCDYRVYTDLHDLVTAMYELVKLDETLDEMAKKNHAE